jgi:hypothetical protein
MGIWLIQYQPTHTNLPLIFQTRYAATIESSLMCSLYNQSTEAVTKDDPELLAKKLLTDLIFKELNLLTANMYDFVPIEIKKMSAKTRIELHEKLYKMISQINKQN